MPLVPPVDTTAVIAWVEPRLRELPWRATRDPWTILVAEVMLQQTQARRVVPAWLDFRASYPTPADCAAASLGDVLRAWRGLGYPRRARNLLDAARTIVDRHAGQVPSTLADLLALPGIGPYTARAVLAFAFERDVAVVDTNIARLLARVSGVRLTASGAQAAADALVPAGAGWLWNQGLMDLGATVCRPAPRCAECPLAPACRWRLDELSAPDPAAGSAGVSTRQARYEGSARQARGRVLAAVMAAPAPCSEFDADIVAGLVADRLLVCDGDVLVLP